MGVGAGVVWVDGCRGMVYMWMWWCGMVWYGMWYGVGVFL